MAAGPISARPIESIRQGIAWASGRSCAPGFSSAEVIDENDTQMTPTAGDSETPDLAHLISVAFGYVGLITGLLAAGVGCAAIFG